MVDISSALTPQKIEFIKAGGSYAIVFGKRLQSFASKTLKKQLKSAYASPKEISVPISYSRVLWGLPRL